MCMGPALACRIAKTVHRIIMALFQRAISVLSDGA